MVDEGPTWVVIDGNRSSGKWAVTMAMEAAIDKAREHAMAIGFVRDFNDAGAFGTYVRMAARENMMAIATNNSLPLVSPWGGMENVLSGAPFAAATPGGEHPPIVTDIQAVEVHDGDLTVFGTPRMYAFNLSTEMLAGVSRGHLSIRRPHQHPDGSR